MSDAVWSARRENKNNTVEQLKKIKLTLDDAGQYQHDDVIKFIKQLKQVAKEQFNPLEKTNGMSKLFEKNRNTINSITTQHAYNYTDILKKSRDEASTASTKETTVKPDITTRQEAQDEVDRLNQIYQAVLGVKEGFKEKICDPGGTDALSSVLQQVDGQHKSIDDYTLYELAEARISNAHTQTNRECNHHAIRLSQKGDGQRGTPEDFGQQSNDIWGDCPRLPPRHKPRSQHGIRPKPRVGA